MKLPYLKNKSWSETTREERLFCAELFFQIRNNIAPFLQLISKDVSNHYDIGYEVCFYRDVLKSYDLSAKSNQLPVKRTFDIVLMSETEFIIIEAKANTGFDKTQLAYFQKDHEYLQKLFKIIKQPLPKINFIAIHSDKYTPSTYTRNCFSQLITWNEITEKYENIKPILKQANDSYKYSPSH